MQPLVQSAIDAANRGENNKALELCKQALAVNPNDVDAWLVVAAVVEQPERKRQCLNRVLTIDPTNQIARDELLDMDRAAMGGTPSPLFQEPAPSPAQPAYQSAPPPPSYPASTSAFEQEPDPLSRLSPSAPGSSSAFESAPVAPQTQENVPPRPHPGTRIEKPLVFRYSSGLLIFLYGIAAINLCGGIALVAAQDATNSIRCFLPALLFGLVALSSTSRVEVSETGIRTATLFTSAAIKWNEIARVQSSLDKRKLKLISNRGTSVNVSAQVKDYAIVVEILRQRRPDLFNAGPAPSVPAKPSTPDIDRSPSTSAPVFTGVKTFKKGFFRQYILVFGGVFLCLSLMGIVLFVNANWDIITMTAFGLVAALGAALILVPFFAVHAIKLERNKLTLSTSFGDTEVSARQIQEIKMKQVYGRYGQVRNVVHILTVEGKTYPLDGFATGEEIMYGFLMNWWNAYKNK